jgi:anti-sigma B factor antagonist
MESSPRLLESIRAALKEAASLELDLKEVAYIDSSGVAVLVQGLKLARKGKVEYSILDPSPGVMAVIHLSQLADFFTIKRPGGEG